MEELPGSLPRSLSRSSLVASGGSSTISRSHHPTIGNNTKVFGLGGGLVSGVAARNPQKMNRGLLGSQILPVRPAADSDPESQISKIRNYRIDRHPQEPRKKQTSANGPMGGKRALEKTHWPARRDSGASQWRGDRPALRAASSMQRRLRTPLAPRSYLAGGRSLPITTYI